MYKNKQKLIEKIFFLIDFAVSEKNKDNPYVKEYVELAFRIAKKANYRVPQEIHQKVCKNCFVIRNSENTRYRIETKNKNKYLKMHCLECDCIKKIKVVKK
jgi:RNase P subunit RPR2